MELQRHMSTNATLREPRDVLNVLPKSKQATRLANIETGKLKNTDIGQIETTSALTRLLQIMDLFTLEHTTIHVDEVVQSFGIVQSTGYRYLKELCDAGLLAQQGKGVYSLGRRIVELDRFLLLSDPLLLAGKPVMNELVDYCKNRAFLLCTYYKDGALCIYKIGPDHINFRGSPMLIQRGRGTLLPLFRGAGSLVILAHLPPHQVKSLYLVNAKEIEKVGLGESWKVFRAKLADIRKAGYAETIGKMNPGMHSVAVPISKDGSKVAGSLLMLGAASKLEISNALKLVSFLQQKASSIAEGLPAPEAILRE
jgi:DNA-binding IclR family transcriptional regulator